jgi:hypothetical protein
MALSTTPSGYGAGAANAPTTIGTEAQASKTEYLSLARLKRKYTDYLGSKREEIQEQQEARRYRHGSHWTAEQIKKLNDRKQPVVTYNRIGRKCDGIVGLVEKLRQDPKAFPRTPQHEQGADLATAALRFNLDQIEWKDKSPICAASGAVDGIGGVELVLEREPDGGYTAKLEVVDIEGFFYDPRSKKHDFSDATYLGCGKWLDAEIVKELFPDKEEEITASTGSGSELTSNADSDNAWFMTEGGDVKNVRLVHICYRHKGEWCYAVFTGSYILMEGKSLFVDEKGKTACYYIMFSAAVDHDGDRYGFVRNLKSAQDEINQRRAKGLHELNVRRIIAEQGAFDDIEEARREAARPDGVVIRNRGFEAEFDDQKKQLDIAGQVKFMEDAKAEIENFGPNPALIGSEGISNRSGRAIALLQQAGIAELGPYMIAYRGWKIRVYRALFNSIQKYWTGERWIRVTDADDQQQFIQINTLQTDPMTGMPKMVNPIGELDVDIILDEGPDSVTMQQDLYETLSQVVPAIAPMLTPQEARAVVSLLIQSSPLDAASKKQFKTQSQAPPPPEAQQAQQIEQQDRIGKIEETKSKTVLNYAKANAEGMPDQQQPQQMEFELPPEVQIAQASADIDLKRAQTQKHQADAAKMPFQDMREQQKADTESRLKGAQAYKLQQEADLMPADLAQKAFDAAEDRKVQKQKPRGAA